MRMLPFFKPKRGFVVAGGGLDTGGGGGSSPTHTTTELLSSDIFSIPSGATQGVELTTINVAEDGFIKLDVHVTDDYHNTSILPKINNVDLYPIGGSAVQHYYMLFPVRYGDIVKVNVTSNNVSDKVTISTFKN